MPGHSRDSDALLQPWSSMYAARMVVIALAAIWGGVAGGIALNSIIELNRAINNVKSFIADLSTDSGSVDIHNVYVPGVLSCTAAFCISLFALFAFGHMCCYMRKGKQSNVTRDQVVFEAVFMALFSFWMLITLTAETVYYATARPHIALSGSVTVTLSGTVVLNPYRRFHKVRTGIILLWFSWLFATICSVVLFVAVSKGPRRVDSLLTSAEIGEVRRGDSGNPDIEHLTRPLDPDEVEKKRSSGAPQPADPNNSSPIAEPSRAGTGTDSPMSEKPKEITSTSASGNAL